MKKSLHIGVFDEKLIQTASPYCGDRVFYKGFLANGYDAFLFDYRAEVTPNEKLIEYAKQIKPDILWFGKCELILPETIRQLRELFPSSIFCKWAADVRDKPTAHDLGHNEYIDYFFATYGGEYLHKHVTKNMKRACSILTFTDSSYYRNCSVDKMYESNILWTGRLCTGDNFMRNDVIKYLCNVKYNTKMFGLQNNWLRDPEYLYYINGTKIGIGVNSFNRRKYSSDRLGNYIACGTFYLPHYFEGIEEVFTRHVNLDWFESIRELDDKIEYYLTNDNIRNEIAKASQKFVLKHFDYEPLVKNILHVINTGQSLYPWDDIYSD